MSTPTISPRLVRRYVNEIPNAGELLRNAAPGSVNAQRIAGYLSAANYPDADAIGELERGDGPRGGAILRQLRIAVSKTAVPSPFAETGLPFARTGAAGSPIRATVPLGGLGGTATVTIGRRFVNPDGDDFRLDGDFVGERTRGAVVAEIRVDPDPADYPDGEPPRTDPVRLTAANPESLVDQFRDWGWTG